MKQQGLKAYRFSIAWTRILPEGRGQVNQAGLKFYSDLKVDYKVYADLKRRCPKKIYFSNLGLLIHSLLSLLIVNFNI